MHSTGHARSLLYFRSRKGSPQWEGSDAGFQDTVTYEPACADHDGCDCSMEDRDAPREEAYLHAQGPSIYSLSSRTDCDQVGLPTSRSIILLDWGADLYVLAVDYKKLMKQSSFKITPLLDRMM